MFSFTWGKEGYRKARYLDNQDTSIFFMFSSFFCYFVFYLRNWRIEKSHMARTTSRMESSWTGPDVSTASLQKFQIYHSKYHLQHSFLAHERMFLRLDWLLVVIISDQKDPFSTWKHHLLSIGTTPFQVFLHFCVLLVSNSDRTRKKTPERISPSNFKSYIDPI